MLHIRGPCSCSPCDSGAPPFHINVKELVILKLFLECQPMSMFHLGQGHFQSGDVPVFTSLEHHREYTFCSTGPQFFSVNQVPSGCLQQVERCLFQVQCPIFGSSLQIDILWIDPLFECFVSSRTLYNKIQCTPFDICISKESFRPIMQTSFLLTGICGKALLSSSLQ